MNFDQEAAHSQLHLCDFDGTLTHEDSFLHFLRFAIPLPGLLGGGFVLIFKLLALVLTGQWSNGAGKAAILALFFKGKSEAEMRVLGEDFCQKKLPSMLRAALITQLRRAQEKGETVVIVSASLDVWLRPFCEKEGFALLCTELEYTDQNFTGNFATPNCKGPEKVQRIRAAYKLSEYKKIWSYGNSKGDAEMFELAEKVFKF